MEGLILVTAIAVTVEALVEYAKNILKTCMEGGCKTTVTQLVSMTIGVLVCLAAGADLYAAIGVTFVWQPLGCILTGVFASRGANFVSDLVKRLHTGTDS